MASAAPSLVLPMLPSLSRTQNCTKVRAINVVKARASLYSMIMPTAANQRFASSATALTKCRRRSSRGLGARCNAAAEIFKIAAVMNGLTLIGVAVGFVLLRIEAFVEESEE